MAFMKSRILSRKGVIIVIALVLALWAPVSRGEGPDLIMAAYYGELSKVKQILSAGAKVDVKDKNDITPLMAASCQDQRRPDRLDIRLHKR